MCQSYRYIRLSDSITAGSDGALKSVDKFCYLGSFLSSIVTADSEITSHCAKAGSAFRKLQQQLWGVRDMPLKIKIAIYQAVVLTTLLYGCQTWTLCRRSIRRLD